MYELELGRREFLAAAPTVGLLTLPLGGAVDAKPAARKTLLFLEAHRDDAEFGAGGIMFKALEAGHRVVIVQGVSDYSNYPPTIGREAEVSAATLKIAREMGAEKIELGYKYHQLPVDDEIKARIAKIVDEVQPDIVLVMTETDYWTDHANMARAGKDGVMFAPGYLRRETKRPEWILAYPTGFNQTFEFQPDVFVNVTDVVDRVAELWRNLDGVISGGKPNIAATLTLHHAKHDKPMDLTLHGTQVLAAQCRWGAMCGARYAEAFKAIVRPAGRLW